MSLDVYLIVEKPIKKKKSSGIFIRENGQTKEILRQAWGMKYEGEPVIFNDNEAETTTVYSANITHNLNRMADAAGVYDVLWRPYMLKNPPHFSNDEYSKEMEFENTQTIYANELIEPLREGLHKLKMNPEEYKKYNPENGWGSYDGLVSFIQDYLNACYKYKNAIVKVDR